MRWRAQNLGLPFVLVVLGALLSSGCGGKRDQPDPGAGAKKIELTSAAFGAGETIPKQYTVDGKNISPPLKWDDPPAGTKSFALVCEDPDAPGGTFTHWVLFNLPPERRSLEEGIPAKETLPDGSRQGKNDVGHLGYGGPGPPPGTPHRYVFKLYALDTLLDLAAGATREQLLTAVRGHVLAEGELLGKYGK